MSRRCCWTRAPIIEARDNESGATPLYHAAAWGRNAMVELLLARGANPDAKNKAGVTPRKPPKRTASPKPPPPAASGSGRQTVSLNPVALHI